MAFYIFQKYSIVNDGYNKIDLRNSYDIRGLYVKRDDESSAKKYLCTSTNLASYHISPSIVTRNNKELEGVDTNASRWSIGGESTIVRGVQPGNYQLSALRIYNRELSEAERLNNWELDKKRFNLK